MFIYFQNNNKVIISNEEIKDIQFIDKKEILKGEIYYHYKNKKAYTVVDFCSVKINDIWCKAVIYKTNNSDRLFARELVSFALKFS